MQCRVWRPRRHHAPPDVDATGGPRILIVSASVGAGHDGAARELRDRLRDRGAVVDIRDFLDAVPAWIRYAIREGYTGTVTYVPGFYDWLYRAMNRPGLVQRIGLGVSRLAARRVRRWCTGMDAVVSTYPLASQTLGLLAQRGRLDLPLTTFLTDPAVHDLWVNEYVGRHLTTISATAQTGEASYRIPMTVAGPLVPYRFAGRLAHERRTALRRELHLPSGRPVALVVAGSLGLGSVARTVDAIVATGMATPLALCGHNQRLLRDLRARAGVVAVGWRDDVHELMQLCDVLVHNAGGLSFSESLVAGLPAVTFGCIPGHGKANGRVLARFGVAPMASTVDDLRRALARQLQPEARTVTQATASAGGADASEIVLADLRAFGQRVATPQAAASRVRARSSFRRRVATVTAVVATAATCLGATEGISAATEHGVDVGRMPAGSVAIVVRPVSLRAAAGAGPLLERTDAAVMLPATLGPADVATARTLAREHVPLLAGVCPATTLLRHPQRRLCGPARTLAQARIATLPIEVAGTELDALDLIAARRDDTTIVIGARSSIDGWRARADKLVGASHGGVWLVQPGPQDRSGADLTRSLHAVVLAASADGIRLTSVAAASERR